MALKDLVADHNHRVFMNMDHFAEIHYWNGEEITCVPDDAEAQPEPNTQIIFDERVMKVLDIHENLGMYDILLTVFDARELI